MIVEYLPNNAPLTLSQGIAIAQDVSLVHPPKQLPTNDFCYCDVDCDYREFAFADLADNSPYKNDTSSFLFNRVTQGAVINFELWKNGKKIADITDSSLGAYYSTFTNQPLYKGVVLDWRAVGQVYGFGLYQFRANQIILGQSSTFESRLFQLMPYSDESADGTVKIVGIQQGNIVGSDLDYTGLLEGGWKEAYRVEGVFGFKEYEIQQDAYQNSNYRVQQIRDQVVRTYTLETKLIPSSVGNWISENSSLANYIEMTDCNLFNTEIFRDVPVKTLSFEDVKSYIQRRSKKYTIKFQDLTPNLIKRNF